MKVQDVPDYLILGSGMAGLTVGVLLATAGATVRILEAADHPGGNVHAFDVGDYRLCAQVHYIFGCEEGGSVRRLLRATGLEDEVPLVPLDRDGYDHVVIAGERYTIPNGFDTHRDRLIARLPGDADALRAFFALLTHVRDDLDRVPESPGLLELATVPLRFPRLLRWRNATLQDVFDAHHLSPRAQAVLAGQAGDYLLPPAKVSFLLHAALVSGYDRGAWYPKGHFGHFVDAIVARIRACPGCSVELGQQVDQLQTDGDRVTGVRTATGQVWTGRTVLSNIDPRRTASLIAGAPPHRWPRPLDYDYSCSSFTMYLGLKDLDPRDHGFGRFNVWHYPHEDINRIYADQVDRGDLSDPWLFLSTPSLHSDAPGLAPPGRHVMVVATSCAHEPFRALEARDGAAYGAAKARVRDRILDVLEAHYLPDLRRHLEFNVVGTPLTQERFCGAPHGNAYGAELTPRNVGLGRVPFETPWRNLFLVNATAGYPSVAGTVRSGQRLFELLQRSAS